jgi:type III restriction enzyme
MPLEAVARAKFRVVDALGKVIAAHRDERERTAFEHVTMFPQSRLEFKTSADHALTFDEDCYSYNQPYKGAMVFQKHLTQVVGDLDIRGEEHECAVYIDRLPAVKLWIRNTVRQPNSFWLQTASDKFYPDFVCQLEDGRVLVVEYKGALLANDPDEQQKKLVGELWAERSDGKCVFAWVENKAYGEINRTIAVPKIAHR